MYKSVFQTIVFGAILALSLMTPPSANAAEISYPEVKSALQPPTDKATVIFYRPKKTQLSGICFYVLDKSNIATMFISNADIDISFMEPGANAFTTQKGFGIKPTQFTLNVEAGKQYYVRASLASSGLKSMPQFQVVTEQQALAELSRCEMFVSKEVKNNPTLLTQYVANNKPK